jgi:NAD(P)-dependent dehydrogenase (short-subunit alcohol dehydrogenase family)
VQVTEDEFDKVFAVNVKSIFHSTRHFIPNLINQGEGGSIINIASIGATRPRPGLVWYNASKAAVANVRYYIPPESLQPASSSLTQNSGNERFSI